MTRELILERLKERCSRAEYSSGQAAAYARRWMERGDENREQAVAEIVEELVRERFVDDSRFAAAFVRDKLKFNGWGRQKIIFRLRALGVAREIIDKAIAENYYSEGEKSGAEEILQRVVKNKWEALSRGGNKKSLDAKRVATIRFAMSRGFDYEDIIKCLNNIV